MSGKDGTHLLSVLATQFSILDKNQMDAAAVIQVQCYSGHTYAERPESFIWQGVVHQVREVKQEWQEPGERHFLVCTEEGSSIEVYYDVQNDEWRGRSLL